MEDILTTFDLLSRRYKRLGKGRRGVYDHVEILIKVPSIYVLSDNKIKIIKVLGIIYLFPFENQSVKDRD